MNLTEVTSPVPNVQSAPGDAYPPAWRSWLIWGIAALLFVIIGAFTSICSGAVVLGFAYSKESVPAKYLGTISGTTTSET